MDIFLGPTIIDNVSSNMKSYQNEIFGPVLQIIEVNQMTEAIKIINNNNRLEMDVVFLQEMENKLDIFRKC